MGEDEDDDRGMPESLTGKILALGLGAYFMTEDAVRRYVKDAKIPRDLARSITQNATKGKDELYGFVARELSNFLRQMDVQAELQRFVSSHKIRISAEVEFLPRPAAPAAGGPPTPPGGTARQSSSAEGPPLEWDVKVKMPQRPPAAPGSASSEEAPLPSTGGPGTFPPRPRTEPGESPPPSPPPPAAQRRP